MESFWAPAKAVSEDILPHSVLLPPTSDPPELTHVHNPCSDAKLRIFTYSGDKVT